MNKGTDASNEANTQQQWNTIFKTLENHDDLLPSRAEWAMEQLLSGNTSEKIIQQFLTDLKSKGETGQEISRLIHVMMELSTPINVPEFATADIVGTGGDGHNTVNISSMASIVASAAGIPIAKHGNRAATSTTGSADILEALGIQINHEKTSDSLETLKDIGITFLFAQHFHPLLKNVASARKNLGIPTVFNLLGPLVNPLMPQASAIGVPNKEALEKISQAFSEMIAENSPKQRRAFIFVGAENADELNAAGPNLLYEVRHDGITSVTITPEDLGMTRYRLEMLQGNDLEDNKHTVYEVFGIEAPRNTQRIQAIQEAVALNAAAGMTIFERENTSLDILEHLRRNYKQALSIITSGKAASKLQEWITSSQKTS